MPNGMIRHAILSNLAIFPVNVDANGWTVDAGQNLISIKKLPYGFFSTVRRTTIDSSVCVLKQGEAPFGWTPSALQRYTGLQFSPTERKLMKDNKAMPSSVNLPLITELKWKIGHLLQLDDELIYIKIKEPGVGCVGLIIRHAILLDRQKGTPVIDMSVCFLSGEISLQVANAVDHLNSIPGRMRQIDMWKEEYSLFQNICNYFRASCPRLFEWNTLV
jgi:hypothetical protein